MSRPQTLHRFRSSSATPCSLTGLVYPLLTVEPKPYRFFILNANNARFLNINLLQARYYHRWYYTRYGANFSNLPDPTNAILPDPILSRSGPKADTSPKRLFIPTTNFFNPITLTGNLLLGNAERADCIIDFTGFRRRYRVHHVQRCSSAFPWRRSGK